MFIGLLTSSFNDSNHTKCVSISNQKCTIKPDVINLHTSEYTQGFHYYPFVVNLNRCFRRCNTLIDLTNKVCVPNETEEDLNLSVFKAYINEIVNVNLMVENLIQIKIGIKINVDVSVKIQKKIICAKMIISGILLHVHAKLVNI